MAERHSREPKSLSSDALAALARHGWPGNVRELRNVVERVVILAPGAQVEVDDLDLGSPVSPAAGPNLAQPVPNVAFRDAKKQMVEDFERSYLIRALREHGGNVSRTAEAIGMVRQSLQQKIRELELRQDDWAES